MLRHERAAWSNGILILAGIDEAGRGPLAGPVVAAAACIPREFLETEELRLLKDLTDSKQLTEARRETFFALLTGESTIRHGIGRAEPGEIDALNILNATHLAMRRAVEAMAVAADLLLVDGRPVPGLPYPSQAIVKGDAQSLLIAAASVLAKVTRDREMHELDARHPGYGFAQHKGYGTAAHLAALRELGPSPVHRRTFAPVAAAMRSGTAA
ncbi:MAG TPA: ribonuclease HII [Kiritimatiellia bacterium]|nr:ribonuclease HII [Kiritimatiellia bacterium]